MRRRGGEARHSFVRIALGIAAILISNSGLALTSVVANGVEIGNGKGTDGKGGFEIGNGFLTSDIFALRRVVGTWRLEVLNNYIGFTAVGQDKVTTRGSIDVDKMDDILSPDELIDWGLSRGWDKTTVGNVSGVVKNAVSKSGIRDLHYLLFRAPTEVLKIDVTGPQGDPGFFAFEKFQKTLESLEVMPLG